MIFRKYLTERNAVAMWKYDFDNNLAQNISKPQQQLDSVQTHSHIHVCVRVISFDLEFINQIMWRLTVSPSVFFLIQMSSFVVCIFSVQNPNSSRS